MPDALEALIATVTEETGAATEIEARLARRLALALWKGERAERIETALFDAAPKLRPPQAGFQWEEADPLTTFDLKRFNAIRGYQAQQGREISRCLKELRLLRKEALAACTGEPEGASENEPKSPPAPANDDATPCHQPPVRTRRCPKRNPSPIPGTLCRLRSGPSGAAAGGGRLARAGGARRHRGLSAARAGARRPGLARSARPGPVPAGRGLALPVPARPRQIDSATAAAIYPPPRQAVASGDPWIRPVFEPVSGRPCTQ